MEVLPPRSALPGKPGPFAGRKHSISRSLDRNKRGSLNGESGEVRPPVWASLARSGLSRGTLAGTRSSSCPPRPGARAVSMASSVTGFMRGAITRFGLPGGGEDQEGLGSFTPPAGGDGNGMSLGSIGEGGAGGVRNDEPSRRRGPARRNVRWRIPGSTENPLLVQLRSSRNIDGDISSFDPLQVTGGGAARFAAPGWPAPASPCRTGRGCCSGRTTWIPRRRRRPGCASSRR